MKTVVVITGASSGLGHEIAKCLLKKGNYSLILNGRNKKGLADFTDSPDVTIVLGDVAKKTTIDLIENAVSELGQIDILINNAGITFVQPFVKNTEKELDEIIAVNLKAPMLLTHRLYPMMVKQQSGLIVNINSVAGKEAKANHTMYSATKFGLKGFADALRLEAKPNRIRVMNFHPGGINTDLYRNMPEIPKEKYMDPSKITAILVHLLETDPSIAPDEIVLNRMTK